MPLIGLQKYYSSSKMLLCGLFPSRIGRAFPNHKQKFSTLEEPGRQHPALQCLQPRSTARIWRKSFPLLIPEPVELQAFLSPILSGTRSP